MRAHFGPGDRVIYRKQKLSVRPGRQAKHIQPARYGDYYSYDVDKFWTVIAVQANNDIVVQTRRGKQLTVSADDPALRRANWLERLLFRHRFPVLKPGERAPTQQDASLAAPSDQPKEPSNIPAERGQS